MRPRIKIQEQDFEAVKGESSDSEHEDVKEAKLGVTKKIHKIKHDKNKKASSNIKQQTEKPETEATKPQEE